MCDQNKSRDLIQDTKYLMGISGVKNSFRPFSKIKWFRMLRYELNYLKYDIPDDTEYLLNIF